MSAKEESYLGRRHCIPVIYTRGTHYEVGFDVGRTFGALIQSFLESSRSLNEDFIPAYETVLGRQAYEATLASVRVNFPQYVRELEGTADGAHVPFYKLFLLHTDRIVTCAAYDSETEPPPQEGGVGCSSICVNRAEQQILGHTEDALSATLNHFYFVSAHIVSEEPQGRWGVTEERFTSLCYAGHLPGYTMSYNHHGLVFTVNTLSARRVFPGKTPRHFLTRALLSAKDFEGALQILKDPGCGAGDGCSVNMTFLRQHGDRFLFHNVEMGPAESEQEKQSRLHTVTAAPGEKLYHCNAYLHLRVDEEEGTMKQSSRARMETLESYPAPVCKDDVIRMLGDQSGRKFRVFQEFGPDDVVKTIAVGIFDCKARTWSLYADNPRTNQPLVTLPLLVKTDK